MGTNLTFAAVLDTTGGASATTESVSFKCEGTAASTFQTTALTADMFLITPLHAGMVSSTLSHLSPTRTP